MASKQEWQSLFKEDKFVNNYKTGERVTGQFAQSLIDQSGLVTDADANPEKSLVVFDNACGTGVVSSLLHQQLNEKVKRNMQLTCGDISEGMLAYTRSRLQREGWQNTEVKIVDAQETGLPSAHYTHAVTAFGKALAPLVLCQYANPVSAYMALSNSLDALDGK
jgi:ubiquinone/menaquinone biosynthesis C-methylase UbiE